MKTEQTSIQIKKIRKEIFHLLDQKEMSKKELFENIEINYDISKSELRHIVREMKKDLIKKLNILQSGIVKI